MEKIIIVKLSSLGDIIHSFPVPYLIKKHFPDTEVHWVAEKKYHGLISLNSHVDCIHDVEIRSLKKEKRGILREIGKLKKLRSQRFDYSLDLQGNIKSGIISRAISAKIRAGFSANACQEALNTIFNNRIIEIKDGNFHAVKKNILLLKALGIDNYDDEIVFPVRFDENMKEEAQKIANYFANRNIQRPIIGISPFAGFQTKALGILRWREIIGEIIRSLEKCSILLFWGPEEDSAVKELTAAFKQPERERLLIAPQTSIVESFYYMKVLDIFISSDTGPIHIADALGIKTIGIYTSTSPLKNGPFHNLENVVVSKAECSPCYKRKCKKALCLNEIKTEEILKRIKSLL